jgi:hypothetical protein
MPCDASNWIHRRCLRVMAYHEAAGRKSARRHCLATVLSDRTIVLFVIMRDATLRRQQLSQHAIRYRDASRSTQKTHRVPTSGACAREHRIPRARHQERQPMDWCSWPDEGTTGVRPRPSARDCRAAALDSRTAAPACGPNGTHMHRTLMCSATGILRKRPSVPSHRTTSHRLYDVLMHRRLGRAALDRGNLHDVNFAIRHAIPRGRRVVRIRFRPVLCQGLTA